MVALAGKVPEALITQIPLLGTDPSWQPVERECARELIKPNDPFPLLELGSGVGGVLQLGSDFFLGWVARKLGGFN